MERRSDNLILRLIYLLADVPHLVKENLVC